MGSSRTVTENVTDSIRILNNEKRLVVLDIETTGLSVNDGHRIIEIGCIELEKKYKTGKYFHTYINPDRLIDQEAMSIHGISNKFLENKPRFSDIANDFLTFIKNSTLIIHNAVFDIKFINSEFIKLKKNFDIKQYCNFYDTLLLAKKLYPGQRNNLNALCKRYGINKYNRNFHGALLDAEILTDLYLLMSCCQISLLLSHNIDTKKHKQIITPILYANMTEINEHKKFLLKMKKITGKVPLWNN